MGPSVRGFGDSIPAFMLIPIPRPKRPAVGLQRTKQSEAKNISFPLEARAFRVA